ncbi:MAG TPA: M56 family metallopeptidase [Flavitalea sp.]|nr:M56 family metallopeptidase [Flavitalea sp.]
MNLVYQSAFLKALGWSLLSSMWQMGILWLIYVGLTSNGKRFSAKQRHTLALFSLIGGSAWFLITLILNFYEAVNSPQLTILFTGGTITESAAIFSFLIPYLEPALPFLSVLYLFFLALLFIRFFIQYRHTQLLFEKTVIKSDPELRVFMRKMAAMLSIKKEIRIWISEFVDTPLTIGFWKPVILLPVAAINHLSIQQAEAIILHELYHIKRNDYLINLLIAFLDILLFFNPFSRLLTDSIKKERENSCDDLVLQFRYEPRTYVNALLLLEQHRVQQHVFTVAATGKNRQFLLNRVKRILYADPGTTHVSQRLMATLFSALFIAFIGWYNPGNVLAKQLGPYQTSIASEPLPSTEQALNFETNSIKPTISKHISKKQSSIHHATHQENNLLFDIDASDETPMISYIQTAPESRDFSIVETEPVIPPTVYTSQYPFVPSTSFSFHYTEDTSLPKKQIITVSEKKAREAKEQALKGLDEINWQKLEKQLGKVDVQKLQREIKKALEEVNWKKVNEELQSSLKETIDANEEVLLQLEKLQESRMVKQEKLRKIKEKVIEDQIQKKSDCTETPKVRKIVVI